MTTIANLNPSVIDRVFGMVAFSYDLRIEANPNGTEAIIFDSAADAEKFQSVYNTFDQTIFTKQPA